MLKSWHYRDTVNTPLELSAFVLSGDVMLQRHMKAHGKKSNVVRKSKPFCHDQNLLWCTSG